MVSTRSKNYPTFTIFDENQSSNSKLKKRNNENKNREYIDKEKEKVKAKKLRVFSKLDENDVCNQKENHQVVDMMKKINLTKDERDMNGAPEGELYDMIVYEDNELFPFADTKEAQVSLNRYMDSFPSSSWAEKYEAVVTLRRIVLFQTNILDQKDVFEKLLSFTIESIESLRSSSVRNGLKCLAAILRNCSLSKEDSFSEKIVHSLLNRTASGPRFICESSYELALQLDQYLNPHILLLSLLKLVDHKNHEVQNKVFLLSSKLIESLISSPDFMSESNSSMNTCLQLIALGLDCKRASGRDAIRKTFQTISNGQGEKFNSWIEKFKYSIDNSAIQRLQREKSKYSAPTSTSFNVSSSLRPPPSIQSTLKGAKKSSLKELMAEKKHQMSSKSNSWDCKEQSSKENVFVFAKAMPGNSSQIVQGTKSIASSSSSSSFRDHIRKMKQMHSLQKSQIKSPMDSTPMQPFEVNMHPNQETTPTIAQDNVWTL